ncbi:RNA export factor gle2 [Recurvomyces mirabilis]|uniref:RNA export factor gle2 n=1 Tax=Recurvomyces mirabilis TaxID=574656 RepID=A0AAE1C053_9PEZI|nr:RNA export factor gle2 [Recurvomyces mirabilis]KAK5152247.1 RNA export factor gle2 [Recurvomyces mirabilis]
MSGLFGGGAANPTQGDLSKDVQVTNGPSDSISDMVFSPASDHLSVTSWDSKCYIYSISSNGESSGVAMLEHQGPALSTCWSKDGQKVFSAGADKAARMLDLAAGHTQSSQATQVAGHDQPIRCVESAMVNGSQILITGGWDKMVKYWDLRQQTPIGQLECKDRVYTMDVKDNMLVVGTADRWIEVVSLANPGTPYKVIQSPLKWQTRVCTIFSPEANGYAIGSIEGRCAIQYVEDKDQNGNFSFKCHRQTSTTDRNLSNVFSVNAISFHPVHGTFSTAGSDGTFHFWDKDAKHRLKGYPEVGGTISATDFDRSGNIFAYAVSYDWSKGHQANNQQLPNKIMLHPVIGDECKPRPKTGKR